GCRAAQTRAAGALGASVAQGHVAFFVNVAKLNASGRLKVSIQRKQNAHLWQCLTCCNLRWQSTKSYVWA
ncbi:MAG: hypothetical protein VW387_06985, partial [Paracoccaceae bacterium]